jgi:hypothetical protein
MDLSKMSTEELEALATKARQKPDISTMSTEELERMRDSMRAATPSPTAKVPATGNLARKTGTSAKGFDPEGTGYDMEGAKRAGLKPDETGHWGSRDPKTGMLFKGKGHPTWDKTVQGEREAGYNIIKGEGGRYYSQKDLSSMSTEELERMAAQMRTPRTLEDTRVPQNQEYKDARRILLEPSHHIEPEQKIESAPGYWGQRAATAAFSDLSAVASLPVQGFKDLLGKTRNPFLRKALESTVGDEQKLQEMLEFLDPATTPLAQFPRDVMATREWRAIEAKKRGFAPAIWNSILEAGFDFGMFVLSMKATMGLGKLAKLGKVAKGVKGAEVLAGSTRALKAVEASKVLKLAAISGAHGFVTSHGDLKERANAGFIRALYRATPILSGAFPYTESVVKVGKVAVGPLAAVMTDFVLNSALTYHTAYKHLYQMHGGFTEDFWLDAIPQAVMDLAMSAQTRALTDARFEMGGKYYKAGDIAKKMKAQYRETDRVTWEAQQAAGKNTEPFEKYHKMQEKMRVEFFKTIEFSKIDPEKVGMQEQRLIVNMRAGDDAAEARIPDEVPESVKAEAFTNAKEFFQGDEEKGIKPFEFLPAGADKAETYKNIEDFPQEMHGRLFVALANPNPGERQKQVFALLNDPKVIYGEKGLDSKKDSDVFYQGRKMNMEKATALLEKEAAAGRISYELIELHRASLQGAPGEERPAPEIMKSTLDAILSEKDANQFYPTLRMQRDGYEADIDRIRKEHATGKIISGEAGLGDHDSEKPFMTRAKEWSTYTLNQLRRALERGGAPKNKDMVIYKSQDDINGFKKDYGTGVDDGWIDRSPAVTVRNPQTGKMDVIINERLLNEAWKRYQTGSTMWVGPSSLKRYVPSFRNLPPLTYDQFKNWVAQHEMMHSLLGLDGPAKSGAFDERICDILALERIGRHDLAGELEKLYRRDGDKDVSSPLKPTAVVTGIPALEKVEASDATLDPNGAGRNSQQRASSQDDATGWVDNAPPVNMFGALGGDLGPVKYMDKPDIFLTTEAGTPLTVKQLQASIREHGRGTVVEGKLLFDGKQAYDVRVSFTRNQTTGQVEAYIHWWGGERSYRAAIEGGEKEFAIENLKYEHRYDAPDFYEKNQKRLNAIDKAEPERALTKEELAFQDEMAGIKSLIYSQRDRWNEIAGEYEAVHQEGSGLIPKGFKHLAAPLFVEGMKEGEYPTGKAWSDWIKKLEKHKKDNEQSFPGGTYGLYWTEKPVMPKSFFGFSKETHHTRLSGVQRASAETWILKSLIEAGTEVISWTAIHGDTTRVAIESATKRLLKDSDKRITELSKIVSKEDLKAIRDLYNTFDGRGLDGKDMWEDDYVGREWERLEDVRDGFDVDWREQYQDLGPQPPAPPGSPRELSNLALHLEGLKRWSPEQIEKIVKVIEDRPLYFSAAEARPDAGAIADLGKARDRRYAEFCTRTWTRDWEGKETPFTPGKTNEMQHVYGELNVERVNEAFYGGKKRYNAFGDMEIEKQGGGGDKDEISLVNLHEVLKRKFPGRSFERIGPSGERVLMDKAGLIDFVEHNASPGEAAAFRAALDKETAVLIPGERAEDQDYGRDWDETVGKRETLSKSNLTQNELVMEDKGIGSESQRATLDLKADMKLWKREAQKGLSEDEHRRYFNTIWNTIKSIQVRVIDKTTGDYSYRPQVEMWERRVERNLEPFKKIIGEDLYNKFYAEAFLGEHLGMKAATVAWAKKNLELKAALALERKMDKERKRTSMDKRRRAGKSEISPKQELQAVLSGKKPAAWNRYRGMDTTGLLSKDMGDLQIVAKTQKALDALEKAINMPQGIEREEALGKALGYADTKEYIQDLRDASVPGFDIPPYEKEYQKNVAIMTKQRNDQIEGMLRAVPEDVRQELRGHLDRVYRTFDKYMQEEYNSLNKKVLSMGELSQDPILLKDAPTKEFQDFSMVNRLLFRILSWRGYDDKRIREFFGEREMRDAVGRKTEDVAVDAREQMVTSLFDVKNVERHLAFMGSRMKDMMEHTIWQHVIKNDGVRGNRITPERQRMADTFDKIMQYAAEEVAVNPQDQGGKYALTYKGIGRHWMDDNDRDTNIRAYEKFRNELGNPLDAADRAELEKGRLPAMYFSLLPAELRNMMIWFKGDIESMAAKHMLEAGTMDGALYAKNWAQGFMHRVWAIEDAGKGKGAFKSQDEISQKYYSFAEFSERAEGDWVRSGGKPNAGDIMVSRSFTNSASQYLKESLLKTRKQETMNIMKDIKNQNADFKLDDGETPGHIIYPSEVEKLAKDWSKERGISGKGMVEQFLRSMGYVQPKFAEGLAAKKHGGYERPWVSSPLAKIMDQMFSGNETSSPLQAWNRMNGIVKRFVMWSPNMFALQIASSPMMWLSPQKNWQTIFKPMPGIIPQGLVHGVKQLRTGYGAKDPWVVDDKELAKRQALANASGLRGMDTKTTMRMLFDATELYSKSALLQSELERGKEALGTKFGIDDYVFGHYVGKIMFEYWNTMFDRFTQKGMSEAQAARRAADFCNDTTGMMNPAIYGQEGRALQGVLFARDFTMSMMRMTTGALGIKQDYATEGWRKYTNSLFHGEKTRADFDALVPYYRQHLARVALTKFIVCNMLQYGMSFMNEDPEDRGKFAWDNPEGYKFAIKLPFQDTEHRWIYLDLLFLREANQLADMFGDIPGIREAFGGRGAEEFFKSKANFGVNALTALYSNADFMGKPITGDREVTSIFERARDYGQYMVNGAMPTAYRNDIKNPPGMALGTALGMPLKRDKYPKDIMFSHQEQREHRHAVRREDYERLKIQKEVYPVSFEKAMDYLLDGKIGRSTVINKLMAETGMAGTHYFQQNQKAIQRKQLEKWR